MTQRQRWTHTEIALVKLAAFLILGGSSVYSQVKQLQQGSLKYRSWESIRCRINRERKREN